MIKPADPSPVLSLSVFVLRTLAEMAAATSVHVVAIIEPIIQHADWFFPEGKTSVSVVFPVSSFAYRGKME